MDDDGELRGARGMALAVRFALELCLLFGAGFAAVRLIGGRTGWLVAVVGVLGLAVLWGLVLSPKARVRLPGAARVVVEAVLFVGVGAALWAASHPGAGTLLALGWGLDRWALHRWPADRRSDAR